MTTEYLNVSGGRLAYEVTGDPVGPLVICSPGLGDLRSTFDRLAAALAADGARVVTTDLRGHGGSGLGWADYSVAAVAGDLLALNAHLGGHAVVFGNSYSGSAAVVAAAREPEAFAGLVLAGAFVRHHEPSAAQRFQIGLLKIPGLGRRLWTAAAWPSLFGRRPADFAVRKAELTRSLARRGGFAAVAAMATPGAHKGTEPLLGEVRVPALVIMGTADPDFPDPAEEARFTAAALGGESSVLLLDGVGHYPQAEAPELVAPAVAEFTRKHG